jgi:hypothetical protein
MPDELIYFDSYLAGVPIEQWRDPGLSAEEYETFVNGFLGAICQPLDELDRARLRTEILAGRPDFKRPYQIVLEAWARHYGKERWGEKTPGNLFYVDVILDMFPDARFIYMVRDPRAGVASMQKVSFFPNDVVFNALSRRKHDIDGRALLKEHVPSKQRMTLQYEELVRDPTSSSRSVCAFLGEAFDPQMFRFHEGAAQYMKDEAKESYNAAATRPITDDRIDAWEDRLEPEQVATVEYLCADIMNQFGYAPTGRRLTLMRQGRIFVKQLYWAYQCWCHRDIRHYTVKHPIFARTRSWIQAWLRGMLRHLPQ